jgi:hypothetical protein
VRYSSNRLKPVSLCVAAGTASAAITGGGDAARSH